jgi:hypothetical protein
MEAIFGHAMATDRFALGSGEALGVHQADSVATKAKGSAFNHVCGQQGHRAALISACWQEEKGQLQ